MRWYYDGQGRGVLQLHGAAMELWLFWGGGEPTRAVWMLAGEMAGWAEVGEA